MATTEHVTTCRLCPAFCGMIVEIERDRVVKSRGDPEHPMSRGYLCPKGRSAGAFHHHPNRLGRPRGLPMPRAYGWVRERALPDGRWRLAPAAMVERLPELLAEQDEAPALRLVSGRALHNHNSMAYGRMDYDRFGEDGSLVAIGMHPDDAGARGLKDGELVEIRSDAGQVRAKLKIDRELRLGAVHLTHGWRDKNVTSLSGGYADPMHGQPVMSAIPVEVERAA